MTTAEPIVLDREGERAFNAQFDRLNGDRPEPSAKGLEQLAKDYPPQQPRPPIKGPAPVTPPWFIERVLKITGAKSSDLVKPAELKELRATMARVAELSALVAKMRSAEYLRAPARAFEAALQGGATLPPGPVLKATVRDETFAQSQLIKREASRLREEMRPLVRAILERAGAVAAKHLVSVEAEEQKRCEAYGVAYEPSLVVRLLSGMTRLPETIDGAVQVNPREHLAGVVEL